MTEVTLKTSWKQVFVLQMRILLQISKVLACVVGIGAVGGIVSFIYNVFFNGQEFVEGLKQCGILILIVLCCAMCFFIAIVLFHLLIDIFIIPIFLFDEKKYVFKLDGDWLTVEKNDKIIIDVPKDNITFDFVNIKIKTLDYNKVTTKLIMKYEVDNRQRATQINLRRIPDAEIVSLQSFVYGELRKNGSN